MEVSEGECLFCKIISGEIQSQSVFEDDDIIAFLDINPMAPLHFLIVPKKHAVMLSVMTTVDLPVLGKMMYMAPILVQELGFNPGPDGGFRLILNNGPDGGQEIPHVHLHVLAGPRPWGFASSQKKIFSKDEWSFSLTTSPLSLMLVLKCLF